jgi:endonuclease/exonuclease/phosphatase family metal-dependent hydrolase
MPTFVTWNIQSARGSAVEAGRLLAALDRFADADVLCLQEVASGFRAQDGAPAQDWFAALAARLPGWHLASFAPLDRSAPEGARQRLGTLVCSRYPVLQVLCHSLPWPADPDQPSMPRGVLEVTLDAPGGLLRVLSVHLEYFSLPQRMAQVERLRALHAEALAHARAPHPGLPGNGPFAALPRAAAALVLGDFNMLPGSPEYVRLLATFEDGTPGLCDAWRLARPGRRHAPTVGLRDAAPGAGLPCTFDYAFVTAELGGRIRQLHVDQLATGSDHQPLVLELDEGPGPAPAHGGRGRFAGLPGRRDGARPSG